MNLNISEPASGFRIAFNMFDTDGNQRVDKNEFLVVSMELFLQSKLEPIIITQPEFNFKSY